MPRIYLVRIWILAGVFFISGCVQAQPPAVVSITPGLESEQPPSATASAMLAPATGTQTPAEPTLSPVPTASQTSTAFPLRVESLQLTFIHMLDEQNGWGISETSVYRTVDGGSRWADMTPPDLPAVGGGLRGFFLDPNLAWVIVSDPQNFQAGSLHRTLDGGVTWQSFSVPFGSGQIQFLDSQNGWALFLPGAAAGSSTADIYHSQDGGQSWTKVYGIDPQAPDQPGGLPFSGSKNGMTFLDLSHGWVAGSVPMDSYSWLFISQNGGQTWQHQELSLPAGYETSMLSIDRPRFFSTQDGILPVMLFSQAVAIDFYQTHDGGLTWNSSTPLEISGSYDFISTQEGWVWDGKTLQVTKDAGQTWTALSTNVDLSGILTQLDFASREVGWALAMDENGMTRLYKTVDGGTTWEN